MREYDVARRWRENLGLTRAQLAEAIGYAPGTIFWMERGQTPPGRGADAGHEVKPRVWLRYKRACEGLQREIDQGRFKW